MNRILPLSAGALLSIALLFTACDKEETATQPAGVSRAGAYRINFVPAKTNGELAALRQNKEANLVRTLAQFDDLVLHERTPLSKLPADVVEDFRQNLTFAEGVGLVGIEYNAIRKMLPRSDFHAVMAVFGLDTDKGFWGGASTNPGGRLNTGEDQKDNACENGKCNAKSGYICLIGCGA